MNQVIITRDEDRRKLLDIANILELEANIMAYGDPRLPPPRVDPRLFDSITAYRTHALWLREIVKYT